MSMIRCTRCGALIDSDDDPECFIHTPDDKLTEHVWCEWCREELDEEIADEYQVAPMSERAGIF